MFTLRKTLITTLVVGAFFAAGSELSGVQRAAQSASLSLAPHLGLEIAQQGNAALREIRAQALQLQLAPLPAPAQDTRNTRTAKAS